MKHYYLLKLAAVSAISFQFHSINAQVQKHDYRAGIINEMTKDQEIEILNRPHDKATTCAGASELVVQLQSCDDVGTASFYTKGTNVNMANSAATVPSIGETCAGATGYNSGGTWVQFNPDSGIDILDIQITGGSLAGGNYTGYIQFFQGASCAALTAIGCMPAYIVTMGIRAPLTIHQEGIDPSQNVWAYIWNDGGKAFSLDAEVIGSSASTITNDNCAAASNNANGCNLGAGPEPTWTGPSNNGKVCTGGTWYSNENTTYFTITAGAGTTGTISVNPISCNNGVTGEAQFAVFNSCACVGTYTAACFRSCAVGTGTLSLTSLTPGATYTLVVDGQAGDICKWTFITTGIVPFPEVPIEMLNFSVKSITNGNRIYWKTASELNTDYFEIERSTDGENFDAIARFKGAGTKSTETEYEYLDTDFESGTNYYRLKEVDFNGEVHYFVPSILNNEFDGHYVYPNPVNDEALVTLSSSIDGTAEIQIIDATGKKVYYRSESIVKGINNLKLNTVDLKSGLYYVNITNDRESKTLKFTK